MTMTARRFVTAQVATSAAALYTAATGVKAVVKRAAFCNTSGGTVTLLVHLVPPAGTAGDGNKVIADLSISAGETYLAAELEGQVIEAGGSLQAAASLAGSLTAVISGVEITS